MRGRLLLPPSDVTAPAVAVSSTTGVAAARSEAARTGIAGILFATRKQYSQHI